MEMVINRIPIKEDQYRKILDFLGVGIQIIDFNWKYVYVNDALIKQGIIGREEFLGLTVMEKYAGIEHTEFIKASEQCMSEHKSQQLEKEFLCQDQLSRWFQLNIEAVEEGIIILSTDISAHKKTQEKLLKATHLFAFISQVNQKIVRVKNEEVLFSNACKLAIEFGKFKMAWIGLFDSELTKTKIIVHDYCGMSAEDAYQFSGSSDIQDFVLNTEKYYICNDIENDLGKENWKPFNKARGINSCMSLPIMKSGKVIGTLNLYSGEINFSDEETIALMVEVTGDISFAVDRFEAEKKHKITEQLVFENEKRYRALIENSTDLITLSSYQGKISYCSEAMTKLCGYSQEEISQLELSDLIHPDDIKDYLEKRQKLSQTPGKSFSHQHRFKKRNGNWFWREGTVTNLLHVPAIHSFVSNFKDISERKIAEQILLNKNDELIKTNQELDRFVYSASHDLRAPLCSMLGLIHFIDNESHEASTLEYAKMLRISVNRLDTFIKNILSYSKNNRVEVEIENISVQSEVEEIVDSIRNMDAAKGVNFSISINQHHAFFSDRFRVNVILENIISNAAKFQDLNKLNKYVKVTGHTDAENLHLIIEDNGIGIPEEYQKRIFEMFFRLSGKVAGSGIGLYIVKETLDKLKASIKVESKEGVGTKFILRLKNLQSASDKT